MILAVLALVILILATACGAPDGQQPKATGGLLLLLSLGALAVSVVLLNAVAKVLGQLLSLSLSLVKVVVTVGLTVALIVGALILAVVTVTA